MHALKFLQYRTKGKWVILAMVWFYVPNMRGAYVVGILFNHVAGITHCEQEQAKTIMKEELYQTIRLIKSNAINF